MEETSKKVRHTAKYKHQPSREQIEGLRIEVRKEGKEITGVTIWADNYWVLDASVLKDKNETTCKVFTGNRIQPLQFEYVEGKGYPLENYLELRAKKKQ